ncbi:predicted protein [Sclerotinia sclerotiorum 1980 UF-70]|uniref:Uncharacterized protein n=1 Tax=Sclerotinia sclerotiorum (strain ATCC 18683 / 1980 / Ss-1) TaxID=665079 RepID=A7F4E9_SCLS1|nr:predicted protein [Sclerotinia sclerotiorum 1980 UF-70]EDN97620.1 predicted protein [Sclerotinia sclerotiorum 1980 UF-70]
MSTHDTITRDWTTTAWICPKKLKVKYLKTLKSPTREIKWNPAGFRIC